MSCKLAFPKIDFADAGVDLAFQTIGLPDAAVSPALRALDAEFAHQVAATSGQWRPSHNPRKPTSAGGPSQAPCRRQSGIRPGPPPERTQFRIEKTWSACGVQTVDPTRRLEASRDMLLPMQRLVAPVGASVQLDRRRGP